MSKLLLCLLLCSNVNAASIEEAKDYFSKRGENSANAELAANMYKTLATQTTNPAEKAILKTNEAQALYYFGGVKTSEADKKDIYERGMIASNVAISNNESSTDATKADKALAHYLYATHLGKWAEANGILSSLKRWPELKEHLDIIDDLDNSVEEYGSLRTRARALHKLPFGDKGDAEVLLAKAVEKTFNEKFGLSSNMPNNIYYLDILAKNRKSEKFCEMYTALKEISTATDEVLLELNPTKLPEIKLDIKNFKNNKGFEEDVEKFADKNC